ncbi:MAG: class I SAM-dependent methyltransferase [Pseudomonadota bacterium]
MKSNDVSTWERLAVKDPYFGVLSDRKYLGRDLTGDLRAEFFESGVAYIDVLFKQLESTLGTIFSPERSLDFGCGVGRLLIPLASRSRQACGVDVSISMIKEAKKNCAAANATNVTFSTSLQELLDEGASFDLVHSFIVFQHIPVEEGYEAFLKLLKLLGPGGVAVLHFPYAKHHWSHDLAYWMVRYIPLAKNFLNLFTGRGFFYPRAQMNNYDLNRLFRIAYEFGIKTCSTRLIWDEGGLGAVITVRTD